MNICLKFTDEAQAKSALYTEHPAILDADGVTVTGAYKFVFGYKTQNCVFSLNAATASVNTSLTAMPLVTYLRLSSSNTSGLPLSSVFNGYFREVCFYPKCLSSTELQALSRP